MELKDKLISVPRRENAGSRSSNRFTYQQVWAFDYILDLLSAETDFMLIMEFHEDIFVLDSADHPQKIDFYQVKTDDKDARFITPPFLIKNANKYPDKMSIMQKLIINYNNFKKETRTINIVSNKPFSFDSLTNGDESHTRATIHFHELHPTKIKKIKTGMCDACTITPCNNECLNIIHFKVSSLDLSNYEDTVMGRFINYLLQEGIENNISHVRSVFYTMMGEIRRINNTELTPSSFEELTRLKSMSKDSLQQIINSLRVIKTPKEYWQEAREFLLQEGIGAITVSKIGKEWDKHFIPTRGIHTPPLGASV